MKVFLDTSVLIPVFYQDHMHHEASFRVFTKLGKTTGLIAAHSLAELYSNLTGMPGKMRVPPHEALLFIDAIREQYRIVTLDVNEYTEAIHALADVSIVGGGIYDGLLAHCAVKAGANIICTWDVKDFKRLGPDIFARVRTPLDA